MNRRELVTTVADATGQDRRTVDATLDAIIDTIGDQLVKGEPVTITGFVKFATKDTPAGERRNPFTGEMVWKPASKKVRATILKNLKDRVTAA